MSEHVEKLQNQEIKAARISGISLGLAMVTMALWGWTPLKNVVPAVPLLIVFGSLVVTALAAAVFRIYRGIQIRSAKARIADKE